MRSKNELTGLFTLFFVADTAQDNLFGFVFGDC